MSITRSMALRKNVMSVTDETYLTYEDVLCIPGKSLESRQKTDLSQYIGNQKIEHPVIPANMDTIAGEKLCEEALKAGGIAILHRFMSLEDRLDIWRKLNNSTMPGLLVLSIGVSPQEFEITKTLHKEGVDAFCIDIAHGHSDKVAELIKYIRGLDKELKRGYKSFIMAGNVATVEGFQFLVDAGADMVKVGIGPGSHCTTRIVTGCGVPQFSAILKIVEERDYLKENNKAHIGIIADGGIKYSGDIVKALGAGADYVMTGSLFAGCDETPGDIIQWKDGSKWKIYRGMASKDAQIGWKKDDPSKIVAEGESSLVPAQGPFSERLYQILGGLQSGMSYIGVKTIEELQSNTRFVKVSAHTITENSPHGKKTHY